MSQTSRPSRLEARAKTADTPCMRTHVLRLASAFVILAGVIGVTLLWGCGHAQGESASDRVLIVLDAGHGGRDPGAICDGVKEADVNLAITQRVAALIEADDRLDVKTTRTLDITVSLEDRIAVANEAGAALYLSVQSNACAEYPDAAGVVTLVSDTLDEGDPSWQFAEVLQGFVTDATGARDRGIRSQDLYLHRAEMPAALIEVGFLTNEVERARLVDSDYQGTIAEAIYDGIVAYLEYADSSFTGP